MFQHSDSYVKALSMKWGGAESLLKESPLPAALGKGGHQGKAALLSLGVLQPVFLVNQHSEESSYDQESPRLVEARQAGQRQEAGSCPAGCRQSWDASCCRLIHAQEASGDSQGLFGRRWPVRRIPGDSLRDAWAHCFSLSCSCRLRKVKSATTFAWASASAFSRPLLSFRLPHPLWFLTVFYKHQDSDCQNPKVRGYGSCSHLQLWVWE